MKTVTIRCEHADFDMRLHVSENDICYIQCGLIQITLSHEQAAEVSNHCSCMSPNLYYENQSDQGRATMTIDPSQLDLKGENVTVWPIG